MKSKKSSKGFWIFLLIAIPVLTVLTVLGGAKLILSGALPEKKTDLIVCIAIGTVSLVLSMFGAFRAERKKFIWGILFAAGYLAMLLLSNLLFFGEGYGGILQNVIAVLAGGLIGSIIGAGKRRKTKHAVF